MRRQDGKTRARRRARPKSVSHLETRVDHVIRPAEQLLEHQLRQRCRRLGERRAAVLEEHGLAVRRERPRPLAPRRPACPRDDSADDAPGIADPHARDGAPGSSALSDLDLDDVVRPAAAGALLARVAFLDRRDHNAVLENDVRSVVVVDLENQLAVGAETDADARESSQLGASRLSGHPIILLVVLCDDCVRSRHVVKVQPLPCSNQIEG